MLQAEAERMTMQEQSKGKHEKSIIIQVSESDFISLTSELWTHCGHKFLACVLLKVVHISGNAHKASEAYKIEKQHFCICRCNAFLEPLQWAIE